MIKLILLDVDGVVKGFKAGINSPYPSQKVAHYLREIQDKGLPICLCTGKVSFAMKKIIQRMDLNNLHITDGGAVILDSINHQIVKQTPVYPDVIKSILSRAHVSGTYWGLYSLDGKFVEAQKYPIELQENPEIMPWSEVENLEDIAGHHVFSKLEIIYSPENEELLRTTFGDYDELIDVQWTLIPPMLPHKIAIITAKGVSKLSARNVLLDHYQIKPAEVLAVGDTMMDWGFMAGCGYVATMGNANDEMKQLTLDQGGFVGGQVDDDGLIDILEHFKPEFDFNHSSS